jgi:hypothetical protein
VRTAQELLDLWEKATKQNPLVLGDVNTENPMVLSTKETTLFFNTLKEMNKRRDSAHFNVARDYEGYNCPVTGNWIEGRAAHRENLKRTGCRVFEPGELEQFKRDRPKNIERDSERFAEQMCEKIGERIGDLRL